MGFVTPLLLGGATLVALPIALHLIMRREAQHLKFPALRFVQQRRNLNQHRLRLRHLVLLALRCAVIALLAFALARPILRPATTAGDKDAPVATALVFDNSLRMEYESQNKSRLKEAKELASWVLQQLPPESPVTVVDRAGRQRGQDMERTTAEIRIERMQASSAVRPMDDALADALRWLEDKPDYRGEIYLFTDMSTEAWSAETLADFRKRLDALPGANVYFIDVGAQQPNNLGLAPLRLSGDEITPGGLLQLTTELYSVGDTSAGEEVTVELFIESEEGEPEKRGQQVVAVGDEPVPIEFSLAGLPLGTHQGTVRLSTTDGLPADNARSFTVEVSPPRKVLLVGEAENDALFLREALAPASAVGLAQARYICDFVRYDQLAETKLADYAAAFLLDLPPLPAAAWQSLVDYVEGSGDVGISLGRRARREELNTPQAQKLLPAKLRWQSRDATYLRPVAVEHPALGELRDLGDAVPWSEFPVFKYWELEGGKQSAYVVASYANGMPALVERQIGDGRVLMLTTSISDPAYDDAWNLLPTGIDPWPFLALANGIADYLAGAEDSKLNYLAGQTVVLPLTNQELVANYVLQLPDGSAVRQPITPGQESLAISATEEPGNYRVRAGGQQVRLDKGFSVNFAREMTQLERVDAKSVVAALGDERAKIAHNRNEIEVRVGLARTGRELFPWLILVVALILAGEGLLANRFYDLSNAGAHAKSGRAEVVERGRMGESVRRTKSGASSPADSREPSASGVA